MTVEVCFHSSSLNQAPAASFLLQHEVSAGALFVDFAALFPKGGKFAKKKELEPEPAEIFKPLHA